MIGRYCLHYAGIANKLTGIFVVVVFWGAKVVVVFLLQDYRAQASFGREMSYWLIREV